MSEHAATVGRTLARAEQERVRRFVKADYWRMAQRDPERFAFTRAPLTPPAAPPRLSPSTPDPATTPPESRDPQADVTNG